MTIASANGAAPAVAFTCPSVHTELAVVRLEAVQHTLRQAQLEQYVGPGGDRHDALARAASEVSSLVDLLKPFCRPPTCCALHCRD